MVTLVTVPSKAPFHAVSKAPVAESVSRVTAVSAATLATLPVRPCVLTANFSGSSAPPYARPEIANLTGSAGAYP
jgi:hypothetical protein